MRVSVQRTSSSPRTRPTSPGGTTAAALLYERAFHERLSHGDPEGAALDANWLIFGLSTGASRRGPSGWIARAQRLVEASPHDCVARGYLLTPPAIHALFGGDPETAYATFTEQREIGQRHGDPDLIALAGFGQGQALIALGRIAEGIALLDETMVPSPRARHRRWCPGWSTAA